MAYVAVQGGKEAIKESNILVEYDRAKETKVLDIQTIKATLTDLVYQVMSEASLYDEDLATLAIKQGKGNMEEAVFLLRAHRSTLPRIYYSTISDTNTMEVERRISASFKDIPGSQYLGKAYDFRQRFLDFSLETESQEDLKKIKDEFEGREVELLNLPLDKLPRLTAYLDQEGLYKVHAKDDREPDDITKRSIEFPSSRSQRLQAMTRGQTGAVTSLGYAELRMDQGSHPNIGELRVGDLPIHVDIRGEGDDEYYLGSILVTEVESFCPYDGQDENTGVNTLDFEVGYGLVFGQNETKAIAMSILDFALEYYRGDGTPTHDDEFIILHIDSVESTGFISHLKLPHYVTFQSLLDGVRSIKEGDGDE